MFDADRPIINSTQDKLNRTVFAKYLARCMLDHSDPESLVVGLYGGWGVGKTSIINLVLEELNFAASNMADDEKPIILNFSAWSYSGQNQLIYSFFRRLSSAMRGVTYLENSDKIIHLLELYVSFFTKQPIPKPLRTKRTIFEKLTFQHREEVYAWESGRDLTFIKAELNELLRKQKHKIIIIIDNISRLYADEIKQIFQIVKSMGDYANTTYLLAFDKEQVIHALDTLDKHSGEAYIEKIIQLPFDVPPIQQQDLEAIFSAKLSDVIINIPEGTWNIEYWADIYYGSLKFFFEHCRDITRYVNTLDFSYLRLRDIVNPVDFFALTALEVFTPQIYFGIRDNKDLFTDLFDNVYALNSDEIKKDRLRCDEIISRSDRISHEIVLDLLMQLFPRIRHIYHPNLPFHHSDSMARKLKRLCNPDLFDAYFRLSLQSGKFPESEFTTLMALANDIKNFEQALARLNQDERIISFLDLLDSKMIKTIPQHHVQAIVSALLENGDLFPQGSFGRLSLDTPMRIHRIIHQLLKKFDDSEQRFAIMQTAIASVTKSIFISVHELREQSREHNEDADTFLPETFRDLTHDQLNLLRQLLITRIEVWAKNGSLVGHPQLLQILYAWREWGDDDAVKNYIKEITKTDKGLIAFLTATLDKAIAQAMTQYEKNPVWEKYLEDINTFIPAKSLEEHAKLLFEDGYFEKLREREQLALMIFLDLIKANTKKIIPKTS